MAIVFTPSKRFDIDSQFGQKKKIIGTVAFDSSHAGAGETLVKSQVGLSTIDYLEILPFSISDAGYVPIADLTNNIVDVYMSKGSAGGLVVASGVDLSAATAVPFMAFGDL